MRKLPSDRQIVSMVHSLWRASLSLELHNIAGCLASQMSREHKERIDNDEHFEAHVHVRLKALVKAGELRRARFLPGKPYYTIA